MEISIAEYFVYALFSYSGMIMLIISIIKEIPQTRYLAIIRSSYMIPSIIASGILASTGINIDINTVTTSNLIRSVNTTQTWTEATTQTNVIVLQNPVWSMFHWLLMIILIWYVIQQILYLLTKNPKQGINNNEDV